jgi:MFS family permease
VTYLSFFLAHPRVLAFGVLLTLFSSFGQTFLISLFVPALLAAFALDTAQFGAIYAGATLLSAASLSFFGRVLDRVALRTFSLAVGLGLVVACFTMALTPSVTVLFLGIFGLRLAGQGLLSLTAATAMARAFEEGRGKALSVSGLGYALGEALLPVLVVLLIGAAGWRFSWAVMGGVIAAVLLPATGVLLRDARLQQHPTAARDQPRVPTLGLFRDWRFYGLLPGNLFLPVVLTALFLYQVPLAEGRGLSAQIMATAFVMFAVGRTAATLISGPLIDRWGSLRLFPVILLPVCAGLAAWSMGSGTWVAFVYLGLAGVSLGVASPMMTTLWAELYGLESFGAIKGIVSMLGTFATALGPLLLGSMLKAGISFAVIIPACAGLGVAIAAWNFALGRMLVHGDGTMKEG